MESLDRSFEDPEHPTLGTRLDRRYNNNSSNTFDSAKCIRTVINN